MRLASQQYVPDCSGYVNPAILEQHFRLRGLRSHMEARERTLSAEHPDTLVSVSNLAVCLEAMGLLKDAEPLYRRALEASERTLGAEHRYTLVSVHGLAACLEAKGFWKDAGPLYRRAWEARERALGAEHPDTLASVQGLAVCLEAMGLLKDAEPLYRRALQASERTLGAEHPPQVDMYGYERDKNGIRIGYEWDVQRPRFMKVKDDGFMTKTMQIADLRGKLPRGPSCWSGSL